MDHTCFFTPGSIDLTISQIIKTRRMNQSSIQSNAVVPSHSAALPAEIMLQIIKILVKDVGMVAAYDIDRAVGGSSDFKSTPSKSKR